MKAFEATLVLLLALVFALAGVAKLRGRAAFAAVLRKLTPRVHGLLTAVIPALEIALALLQSLIDLEAVPNDFFTTTESVARHAKHSRLNAVSVVGLAICFGGCISQILSIR